MIAGGIAIGGGIGAVIARRIPMTAMPELVAAFHSLVGMAAVLVAAAAFYAPEAFGIGTPGAIHTQSLVEMSLGVAIGAITFTGSIIAFLKLSGRMSGKPILLPGRHALNIGLALRAHRLHRHVLPPAERRSISGRSRLVVAARRADHRADRRCRHAGRDPRC
jgi:NAD(P) transhydrogenase subunit beta